jgi:hypothetical protein
VTKTHRHDIVEGSSDAAQNRLDIVQGLLGLRGDISLSNYFTLIIAAIWPDIDIWSVRPDGAHAAFEPQGAFKPVGLIPRAIMISSYRFEWCDGNSGRRPLSRALPGLSSTITSTPTLYDSTVADEKSSAG